MNLFHFKFLSKQVAICLVLSAPLGCNRGQPHNDDHAHDEPQTAQITVWSERYEVFAEHQAPVAGEATTFITHVTDLLSSEPRRKGPVTFKFSQGDVSKEHSEPTPARDGIYLPGIVFPRAGDWALTLIVQAEHGDATVDLGAITVYADDHSAAHAVYPEEIEGVSFLKEQQWKILSRAEPATKRTLIERLRLPGRVRAKPGHRTTLTAPFSGHLVAPKGQAPLRQGSMCEVDQILALLRPSFSELAVRLTETSAEFGTAKVALIQAESAYLRTQKLAKLEAKSNRELQEAKLIYDSAKVRFEAASKLQSTFRQLGGESTSDVSALAEIRSPIKGVVDVVRNGPGEFVSEGQPIFTVIDPDTLWIEAHIPETKVSQLSSSMGAFMEIFGKPNVSYPITGEGRGELVSLGLQVDTVKRTVPIIYETLNPEGRLRLGQNVRLHVETSKMENALAVPETALVEEGDQLIAFVQVSGETFEKREVTTGIRDTGFVQIIDGIKSGDRVVTKGGYAMRLSSISGVIPAHGHAH
jgi:cobalt-zinc-cadmium efflux system membrane fusion protein